MKCDVPEPNLWRREWLVGAECRTVVTERINTALMLYQAGVAKRSTALAQSAYAAVAIGGTKTQYWEGTLTVGEVGAAAGYVLPHEFGADERYNENRGDPTFDETEGAHDLNAVLQALIWVPM